MVYSLPFFFLTRWELSNVYIYYTNQLCFNSNILETNLINIVLLLGLLFYANKVTFLPLLEKRKGQIVRQIEESEENVRKASSYYFLAEKSFLKNVAQFTLLHKSCQKSKIFFAKQKCNKIKDTLSSTFLISENLIHNYEKKAFVSLQKYAIIFIASKLVKKFGNLSKKDQAKALQVVLLKLGKNV